MHGLTGERVLMRIHLGERDRFEGRPLYEAIVEYLRKHHCAGATVTRAIMGFGATARLHTDKGAYLLREAMHWIERRLDPATFVRIHRSYIVNAEYVRELRTLGDRRRRQVPARSSTQARPS